MHRERSTKFPSVRGVLVNLSDGINVSWGRSGLSLQNPRLFSGVLLNFKVDFQSINVSWGRNANVTVHQQSDQGGHYLAK